MKCNNGPPPKQCTYVKRFKYAQLNFYSFVLNYYLDTYLFV